MKKILSKLAVVAGLLPAVLGQDPDSYVLPLKWDGHTLKCDDVNYGGVDWPEVRRELMLYADKFLDRPGLLTYTYTLAAEYHGQFHFDNPCVIGDVTLRFMAYLGVWSDQELVDALQGIEASPHVPVNGEPVQATLLRECWHWFVYFPVPYEKVLESGWPMFSAVAGLAERARTLLPATTSILSPQRISGNPSDRYKVEGDDMECTVGRSLERLHTSFHDAVFLPTNQAQQLLSLPSKCVEAKIAANFALADLVRFQSGSVARDIAHMNTNSFYYRYSASSPGAESALLADEIDDVGYYVRQGRDLLLNSPPLLELGAGILRSTWPMWRVLDRVQCDEAVKVQSSEIGIGDESVFVNRHEHMITLGSTVRIISSPDDPSFEGLHGVVQWQERDLADIRGYRENGELFFQLFREHQLLHVRFFIFVCFLFHNSSRTLQSANLKIGMSQFWCPRVIMSAPLVVGRLNTLCAISVRITFQRPTCVSIGIEFRRR